MAETSIEWTDATWNPVAGCTVLTAGCTNCYAMRMAARLERVLDRLDAIRRVPAAIRFVSLEPLIGSVAQGDLTGIDWAIVGGASGPRARGMNAEWVDEIEAMCRRSGTAFFFKQWGGKNKKAAGRLLRGRTYDELPGLSM
ncbi:MAG: DUF5131 family protein [Alphaproteobacteria bacterium]|jgi:protein gp37|nr:MAG: DUF5131 family protein [Alphaproteobacteria bacterium]